MEIKTLKDLKKALKDIPDEALEGFGAGVHEDEFVELLIYDEESEDAGFSQRYSDLAKKYPVIDDIAKWIKNVAQVQDQLTTHEEYITDDAISSEDKIEIKIKKA